MKLFSLLFCLLFTAAAMSQSVVPIRGDTLKVGTLTHRMELVLLNSSKDSNGIAVNDGGGHLVFRAPARVNDSTIQIGGITIVFGNPTGGSGNDTIFLGGIDTVFTIPIGVASGAIETIFPVNGDLRTSRWGPGYGWAPFLASDSLAFGVVDTSCSSCPASKDYVDARSGSSTIAGTPGELLYLTANGTAYTAPILNDTSASDIKFLKLIEFPSGHSQIADVVSTVDASKIESFFISGSRLGEFNSFFATVSAGGGLGMIAENGSDSVKATNAILLSTHNFQEAEIEYSINTAPSSTFTTGAADVGSNHSRFTIDYTANAVPDPYVNRTHLFQLDSLGNIYGVKIAASTYTPTATNVINATGTITPGLCHYHRINDEVWVDGTLAVGSLGSVTATFINISLPIASNFTVSSDATGHNACGGCAAPATPGFVAADATNDKATIEWIPINTSGQTVQFQFSYTVK